MALIEYQFRSQALDMEQTVFIVLPESKRDTEVPSFHPSVFHLPAVFPRFTCCMALLRTKVNGYALPRWNATPISRDLPWSLPPASCPPMRIWHLERNG